MNKHIYLGEDYEENLRRMDNQMNWSGLTILLKRPWLAIVLYIISLGRKRRAHVFIIFQSQE